MLANTMVELIRDGTLARFILTFMLCSVVVVLMLSGRTVPEWYQVLVTAIIAYYFSAQNLSALTKSIVRTQEMQGVK